MTLSKAVVKFINSSLVVLQYLYFYMWKHLQNKTKNLATLSCALYSMLKLDFIFCLFLFSRAHLSTPHPVHWPSSVVAIDSWMNVNNPYVLLWSTLAHTNSCLRLAFRRCLLHNIRATVLGWRPFWKDIFITTHTEMTRANLLVL